MVKKIINIVCIFILIISVTACDFKTKTGRDTVECFDYCDFQILRAYVGSDTNYYYLYNYVNNDFIVNHVIKYKDNPNKKIVYVISKGNKNSPQIYTILNYKTDKCYKYFELDGNQLTNKHSNVGLSNADCENHYSFDELDLETRKIFETEEGFKYLD